MNTKQIAVVDGANVAYLEASQAGQPKVSNLVAVRQELQTQGYDAMIVVDASLRHQIDDPAQLEALIENQSVRQAPAGTDADYFILEIADDQNALVVSNDEFEQYQDQYPWIEERRVPLMIVNGEVKLYERKLAEHHPPGKASNG